MTAGAVDIARMYQLFENRSPAAARNSKLACIPHSTQLRSLEHALGGLHATAAHFDMARPTISPAISNSGVVVSNSFGFYALLSRFRGRASQAATSGPTAPTTTLTTTPTTLRARCCVGAAFRTRPPRRRRSEHALRPFESSLRTRECPSLELWCAHRARSKRTARKGRELRKQCRLTTPRYCEFICHAGPISRRHRHCRRTNCDADHRCR